MENVVLSQETLSSGGNEAEGPTHYETRCKIKETLKCFPEPLSHTEESNIPASHSFQRWSVLSKRVDGVSQKCPFKGCGEIIGIGHLENGTLDL